MRKHHIHLEYGDEQADAGQDCRTRLVRPNFQVQTGTGKKNVFPVQLTTNRIGNLTRLILTLATCDDHTYSQFTGETCRKCTLRFQIENRDDIDETWKADIKRVKDLYALFTLFVVRKATRKREPGICLESSCSQKLTHYIISLMMQFFERHLSLVTCHPCTACPPVRNSAVRNSVRDHLQPTRSVGE